jgi:hypothetical protein
MKHLFTKLFLNSNYSSFRCETCILAKSHHVFFPINFNKSDVSFTLVHSNVWRPSFIITVFIRRWFVTFMDDCTRMTQLYLMKHKYKVFDVFHTFHAMIHN